MRCRDLLNNIIVVEEPFGIIANVTNVVPAFHGGSTMGDHPFQLHPVGSFGSVEECFDELVGDLDIDFGAISMCVATKPIELYDQARKELHHRW